MSRSLLRQRRCNALANVLLPKLAPDVAIPPAAALARALKVSRPTAWSLMRSVLEDNGVEVYRDGAFRRLVVRRIAMMEERK